MYVLNWFVGLVVVAILISPKANASSCLHPTPLEHIESSDLIFYGQVDEASEDLRDGKMRTITVKVLRAYKGVDLPFVKIKYYNDGGANWGWGFQNRQSVLIFAGKDESSSKNKLVGSVSYCDMIIYHGRTNLHAQYWDHLTKLK